MTTVATVAAAPARASAIATDRRERPPTRSARGMTPSDGGACRRTGAERPLVVVATPLTACGVSRASDTRRLFPHVPARTSPARGEHGPGPTPTADLCAYTLAATTVPAPGCWDAVSRIARWASCRSSGTGPDGR